MFAFTNRSVLVAVFPILLAACDGGSPGYDAGWQDPDALGDMVSEGDSGCVNDETEPEPSRQVALFHDEGFWIYEGVVVGMVGVPPVNMIQLEIWPDRGGPEAPGTYDLSEGAYDECGLCMLVRQSCYPDDGLARCVRDYLAVSGTVDIESLEETGGSISGAVHDAVLVETEIDWDGGTFSSSPVAGGAMWCLDVFEFESFVTEYPER